MSPRQTPCPALPAVWLFSDARMGGALLAAIRACPPRSGVVLRHDHLPLSKRARLIRRVRRLTRARRMTLLLAGSVAMAARWHVQGVHMRRPTRVATVQAKRRGLVVSAPVHDDGQRRRARAAGVDLLFISPVHATRSHPDVQTLGARRYHGLARGCGVVTVPLGGMTAARARMLHRQAGGSEKAAFAAIDYWLERARRR
jgi:thiamine-phosphate pyrophosphorylase